MTGNRPTSDEGPTLPTSTDLWRRLRRIEGQVRGLQRMIEEGRPCSEVLIQLSALREAVNRVGVSMIARHMESCLCEEDTSTLADVSRDRRVRLKEAVQMFLKFS